VNTHQVPGALKQGVTGSTGLEGCTGRQQQETQQSGKSHRSTSKTLWSIQDSLEQQKPPQHILDTSEQSKAPSTDSCSVR